MTIKGIDVSKHQKAGNVNFKNLKNTVKYYLKKIALSNRITRRQKRLDCISAHTITVTRQQFLKLNKKQNAF